MPFTAEERTALLDAKWVGETVLLRLESIGCDSIETLRHADAKQLCSLIAAQMGSTCWSNSPQAQQAITNAIAIAQKLVSHEYRKT